MAGDVIGEVNHIVHPVFVNGRGNRRTATGSRDVVFGCKQRGRRFASYRTASTRQPFQDFSLARSAFTAPSIWDSSNLPVALMLIRA